MNKTYNLTIVIAFLGSCIFLAGLLVTISISDATKAWKEVKETDRQIEIQRAIHEICPSGGKYFPASEVFDCYKNN